MEIGRPNNKIKSLTIKVTLPQQLRSSFDLFVIKQTEQNTDGLVRESHRDRSNHPWLGEIKRWKRKKGCVLFNTTTSPERPLQCPLHIHKIQNGHRN